jgi:hypothetical protein
VTQKKSEELDRLVTGYLKAARDKKISPAKRLQYRGEAKRGRALANWLRKLEAQKGRVTSEATSALQAT